MSGQPNLRPYGDSWGNNAQSAPGGSLEEQALSRASQKLALVRSGRSGDEPAGLDLMLLLPSFLLALLLGAPLMFFGVMVMVNARNGAVGGLMLLVFGLLFMLIPLVVYLQTRLSTPKGALLSFYKSLARGRNKRARKLIVRPDLDQFPRFQPMIADLGTPTNYPRGFNDERAFGDYWRELLLSGSMPYCLAAVKGVRETPISADVMLVDFELKLIMNTRMWLLLFLVIGLLAAIIDLATRKTVTVPMRKVLVRVGEEWRIFSGEWQGYEEFNLDWTRKSNQPANNDAAKGNWG